MVYLISLEQLKDLKLPLSGCAGVLDASVCLQEHTGLPGNGQLLWFIRPLETVLLLLLTHNPLKLFDS